MIHANEPFKKFRMVFIIFSLATIKFSYSWSACRRHIRLICSTLTISLFDHIQTLYFSMIHAHLPFKKFRMVFIICSLTTIKFSYSIIACSRHIRLICSALTLIFCCHVIFDCIQTLNFSMTHAHGPWSKYRVVFIIFSYTTIKFSCTRTAYSRHIRWICSVLTLIFVVVFVLIIFKHYISQWYMHIYPSTSLGWSLSSFHWLSSIFILMKCL